MAHLLLTGFHHSNAQAAGNRIDCDSIVEHAQRSLEEGNAAQATAAITAALPQCPGNAQAYALLGISLTSNTGTRKLPALCGPSLSIRLGALS